MHVFVYKGAFVVGTHERNRYQEIVLLKRVPVEIAVEKQTNGKEMNKETLSQC